jgi:TPR repeat protein
MYLLGSCYDEGIGVKKSLDEAFRWYELAASKNYPAALIALGAHYFAGNGVGADESQAILLLSVTSATGRDREH